MKVSQSILLLLLLRIAKSLHERAVQVIIQQMGMSGVYFLILDVFIGIAERDGSQTQEFHLWAAIGPQSSIRSRWEFKKVPVDLSAEFHSQLAEFPKARERPKWTWARSSVGEPESNNLTTQNQREGERG